MKTQIVIAMLALGLSAYAQNPMTTTDTTTTVPAIADNQIAQVLITINDGEIDVAKRAESKATLPEAKDFAKQMVENHKANKSDTKKIAKEAGVSPRKSNMSRTIQEDADAAYKELKKADKEHFDSVYMKMQVDMHQKTLDMLDTTLIPNAMNANLREHLKKTRDTVAKHLQTAKNLQAKVHVQ